MNDKFMIGFYCLQERRMCENKSKYEHKIGTMYLAVVLLSVCICGVLILWKNDWLRQIVWDFVYDTYQNPKQLIQKFRKEKSFVGDAVWTLTTLIPPFITLYYSLLGSRNYGLTNRKIIAYTVGSLFIPILVILNAVVVAIMTWMYYTDSCTSFYVVAIYSCLLQGLLISVCLMSTTRIAARHAIKRIEERQVGELYKFFALLQPKSTQTETDLEHRNRRQQIEGRMGQAVFHMDNVLRWDETFSEKREMIQIILMQPFHSNLKDKQYSMRYLYEYIYRNFRLMSESIKQMINSNEGVYGRTDAQGIYGVIKECFCYIDQKYREDAREHSAFYEEAAEVYFGAFLNSFIPETILWERWGIFTYILNTAFTDMKLKQRLIKELILSLLYNEFTHRLYIDNNEDIKEMIACFRDLPEIEEEFRKLQNLFRWERELTIRKIRTEEAEYEFNLQEKDAMKDVQRYFDMMLTWIDDAADNRMSLYDYIYRIGECLCEGAMMSDFFDYYMNTQIRKDGTEDGAAVQF